MNLILLLIGIYFAGEGAANIWWWSLKANIPGEIWFWEVGRFIRTILGFVLIVLAFL